MHDSPSLRRIPTRTLLLSVAVVLGAVAVVFGTLLAVGLSSAFVRDHIYVFIALALLVQAATTILALIVVLRRKRIPGAALGLTPPAARLLHLLWQIPASVVFVLSVQFLVFALTGSELSRGSTSSLLAESSSGLVPVIGFVAIAVLTPVWEELFFRGVIYGFVAERLGTLAAVGISAVVFALCHGAPILLPYLIALGLCLGFLRWFHRNLWGPLALHMTINSIASFVLLRALLG